MSKLELVIGLLAVFSAVLPIIGFWYSGVYVLLAIAPSIAILIFERLLRFNREALRQKEADNQGSRYARRAIQILDQKILNTYRYCVYEATLLHRGILQANEFSRIDVEMLWHEIEAGRRKVKRLERGRKGETHISTSHNANSYDSSIRWFDKRQGWFKRLYRFPNTKLNLDAFTGLGSSKRSNKE